MEKNINKNTELDFTGITPLPTTEETSQIFAEYAVTAVGKKYEDSKKEEQTYKKRIDVLSKNREANLYLLFKSETPIASLGFNFYYDLTLSNITYVYSIFVPEEQRRKGYGSKAMYFCYFMSVLNNSHHIFFDVSPKNSSAIKAYVRLGCYKAKETYQLSLFDGHFLEVKKEEMPLKAKDFYAEWVLKLSKGVKIGKLTFGKVHSIDFLNEQNKLKLFNSLYSEDLEKFKNILEEDEGIKFENFTDLLNSQSRFKKNNIFLGFYTENGELLGFLYVRIISHPAIFRFTRLRHIYQNEDFIEYKNEFFEYAISEYVKFLMESDCSLVVFLEKGIKFDEQNPELKKKIDGLCFKRFYDVYGWDLKDSCSDEVFNNLMKNNFQVI